MHRRNRPFLFLKSITGIWLLVVATISEAEFFPEPLTLDFVLGVDVALHPNIQTAAAMLQLHQSGRQQVDAADDLTADLQVRAQIVEPSQFALDQSRDDHQVSLLLRKQLYDFGRSSALQAAASANVESGELILFDAINQHRIAIMTQFFDVLLADLKFIHDNEAMSMAFVRLDRARSRNELGQLSDIELYDLENSYQKTRRDYSESQSLQRRTRARLANALNRPGELVSEIAEPVLFLPGKLLPDVEHYQQQAEQSNPVLGALRHQLKAAERQIDASRADKKPILESEIAVSEYARKSGSHDEWRAAIILDIPLMTGDSIKAQVTKRRAERKLIQSQLRATEMDIAQSVLETWQHMEILAVSRQQIKTQIEFRDLYLERSRALYEMEVQSDLGDAMVQMSGAHLQLANVEYQIVLAWVRLQALIGNKVALPKAPERVNDE